MAIKINFDPTHNPELPTLILAKKNGEKFGVLKYRNLVVKDCLTNPTEINFTIDKFLNGEKNNYWDEILNFRTVYCKEWDIWFELTMDIDEADSTIKNVACVELSQAELSQIMLYNIEINTETDIEREDYVHPTVLYNKDKPRESLLNRIMGKADHYSIEYVSPTIANIQRTFTFDDTSLYDAFNKIAEEIDCLFVFDSGTKSDGKIARGISVYDLEANCLDCGHRGEFTQKCPKCDSENIDEGYGDDTTIFVTADEIAKNIKLSTDTGAVKNCFKLQAGDDLMTATIRNCNPNGTDYIWYLSNTVKEDMSEELKAKIAEYDATYENYRTKYKYEFHPAQVIGNYNSVINTYKKYKSDLSSMPNPIWGYSDLVKEYYNATDFLIYLQSELMPDASLSDTNANFQLALLTTDKLSPVSVTELNNLSLSTANNVVLSMARAIVDLRYEVEIVSSSLNGYTWTGRFSVVNYSDEEDVATGTTDISIVINDDYENFLNQKLFETLSKNNENISISGLFDISKSLSEFDSELKKYCLDSLLSFQSICQSCLDILIEQDISASWDSPQDSLYSKVYEPYLLRMKSIEREIDNRESEIFTVQTTREYIEKNIALTHADLDFQKYIGENLWHEFILYRREDKYSNDNYISDGLNNAELIQKASEFISVAEKEIFKSAELQHSISASLNDFLVIDKFQPLIDYFNVGNWIRIRIDDEVYKLRLLSYEIDFDNFENISVEFSDVFKTIDGYADQESVISNAAKMSSSYSATQRQASLGEQSQATLDAWYLNGINTATTKIINEADDQCQIWDRHGMLFKKFDTIKNDYNPNQMKIINSTIALTTDNWTTTKMAIGLFKYVDPNTQEEKEVYGVNGETIIGNLLLGKNLNITNSTGSMMFDENGLTVSNGVNTITINPNETYLFNIKNQEEDLLSFDETDGSLKIVGNIVAKNLKLTNNLDYNKLLYVDSNGLVTGIEIDTELNLSSTNPIQNKIITAEINELKNKTDATNGVVGNLSNTMKYVVFKSNIDSELNLSSENPVQNKVVALRIEAQDSQLTQLQEKVNTNIDTISSLDGKVTNNETDINTLKENREADRSEIDGLSASVDYMSEYKADTSTVNGVISNVSKLDERVTDNETAISSNTSNINAVNARVDRLYDADTQFSKDLASVNATANIAKAKAETNQTDIGTLKEYRTEDRTDINSLIVSNQELKNTVQKNVLSIADNTGSIETINENVQNNAENIGINTNEISVLKNNVSSLGNGLSATVNRVAVNEADISTLKEERTADRTDITKLLLSDQEMKTSLSGVIRDVADNQADISTLKENRTEDRTDINSLIVSNQELENTVKKNVLSIADNSGNINANKSEIALNRTTLGYQKKNLFKNTMSSQTINGIGFVCNSDGTVKVNGTATANTSLYMDFKIPYGKKVRLTGCPSGGSSSTYALLLINSDFSQYVTDVGDGVNFNLSDSSKSSGRLRIDIMSGVTVTNLIFKPMVRYADITDDTYEPYVDDVDTRIADNKSDITINQSTLGYQVKNLFDVFSVNWAQPSKTTVSEDGTVTATVTSDPREFKYSNSDAFVTLGAGTYKVIVNTTNFVSGTYAQINAYNKTNNSVFSLAMSSKGIHKTTFTLTERTTVGMVIKAYSQTFTVMICDAGFEDESYVPYTKSTVDERLNRFENQALIYNNTSVSASVTTLNIANLFTNHSAVLCNISTSSGTYSLTLPLRYIKSLGTADYYNAEGVLFYYVDDSNITVRTGLGQSNPTINSIKIISLY